MELEDEERAYGDAQDEKSYLHQNAIEPQQWGYDQHTYHGTQCHHGPIKLAFDLSLAIQAVHGAVHGRVGFKTRV